MAELKLGSINVSGDIWSIAATTLPAGEPATSVSVASGKAMSQSLGGYGTLKLDADGETLTLQGGSNLTGVVSIVETDEKVSLSAVSFGAAVSVALNYDDHKSLKTVVGSSSADSISVTGFTSEEFVLNAGAGNDTVLATNIEKGKIDAGAGNDLVSVSGTVGEVVLGGGKDTLAFAGNATVKVSDYNFKDDVIVLKDAVLDKTGKLSSGSKEVTGFTAENGVFYVKTVDTATAPTTVLATAEEDARKVTINANVSDVKKENVVIIDAQAADSANITLGKASVVAVSLNANNDTADVITVGDTKATVNAAVTGFATDDVLNFTGLTFANTSIGFENGVTLGSGKVSLNLGKAATVAAAAGTASEIAKFNLNGTQLFAATAADQVIDLKEETDLSKIWVKGTNTKTDVNGIQVAAAKLVDLRSELIYNINSVKLTEETVAKASVIGTKNDDMGISIDASKTADGVAVWANNSSTKQSDRITLGAGADTLYFGSTDGKDSVSDFSLASDVLFLHDADYMTAKDGVLTIGKAEMSLGSADYTATTEEIMQVQGAKFAGTVYAAGDFITTGSSSDVIQLGENAGKVDYYAVGKNANISVSSAMTDTYTFLQSYNYAGVANKAKIAAGGSVASINAGAVTDSDAKVIIEGVANVTLGAGTNEYWANGVKDAVVELTNSGADKIYFSTTDKKVTVSGAVGAGFDTESDVIALVGSIDDFTAKADTTGTNAVISNSNKGALTITGVTSDIALVDGNNAKYKLFVNDVAYTTNNDGTNIYLGAQLTASSEVTATTTIVEAEGVNKWGLTSSAIVGKTVKTIDMSGSSADFVLVGSAATANTITGGTGTNWLNGGGASKDVLNGVTGAVDYFYYNNVADGNDTLVNVGTEDTVVLYDVTEAAIDNAKVADDKTVITFKNSDSKLTITGSIDGVTFQLADATYKYDSSADDKWVKQNV